MANKKKPGGVVLRRIGPIPLKHKIRAWIKPKGYVDIVLSLCRAKNGSLYRVIYINFRERLGDPPSKTYSGRISAATLMEFLKEYMRTGPIRNQNSKIQKFEPEIWEKLAKYRIKWDRYERPEPK